MFEPLSGSQYAPTSLTNRSAPNIKLSIHRGPGRSSMLYCSPRYGPMTVRARRGLGLWIAAPALRRAVAVVCALAFVLVSFAHGMQHFNGPTSAISIQTDLGAQDDGPDTSKKASIAFEHCQGCSMIATPVLAPSTMPDRIEGDLPARRFDLHRPHSPVAETPPPIASI